MFNSRQILFNGSNQNSSNQLNFNIDNIEVLGRSILRYKYKQFPIGTPFSIIKMKGEDFALFPFPITGRNEYPNCYKTDINRLVCCKTNNNIVSSKIDKDVVIDHEVIKIEEKINSEFINNNKIPKFVKNVRSISFYVEDVKLLDNFLGDILKLYKYNVSLECYVSSSSVTTLSNLDNIYAVVSFFDIKHFIPIFDNKYVDGMGIVVKIGHKTNISHVSSLTIIVSNYRRNLFYIDGVNIKPHPYEIKNSSYASILSNIIQSRIINKRKKEGKNEKSLKDDREKNKKVDKKKLDSGGVVFSNGLLGYNVHQVYGSLYGSYSTAASTTNMHYWK